MNKLGKLLERRRVEFWRWIIDQQIMSVDEWAKWKEDHKHEYEIEDWFDAKVTGELLEQTKDDDSRTVSYVGEEPTEETSSNVDIQALRSAKTSLKKLLKGHEGLQGVGIGTNSLRVNILASEFAEGIPSSHEGFEVETVVIGQLTREPV